MGDVARLLEVLSADEGSLCENANSAASNTYTVRSPCIGYALTTPQERIVSPEYRSRMNEWALSNIGPREIATLEHTYYFGGHGSTANGALTSTFIHDWLGDGLGGTDATAVATTISGAASTATSINVTSAATFTAGGILRVGDPSDSLGKGYAALIGTPDTTPTPDAISLLIGLPAAPTTAGHVVYGTLVAYHHETNAATLGTKRFLVGFKTSGLQFHLMGGQLGGFRITWDVASGRLPEITFIHRFLYWDRATYTIPSALTPADNFAAPVAGGDLAVSNYGTATRTSVQAGLFELTVDVGLEPIPGTGGEGEYQIASGWARTLVRPTVRFRVPYDSAWQTWWDTKNHSLTLKQLLFQSCRTDGRVTGAVLPRIFPIGPRPTLVEVAGQNYVEVMAGATESGVTTSELTKSAVRVFIG